MKTIALTGHRVLKPNFNYVALTEKLKGFIQQGYTTFYCGMAVGFDLCCADILLCLKQRMNIRFIACIPCKNQDEKYSAKNKTLYRHYLEKCNEIVYLQEEFSKGCMFARNRYMVDNAHLVFAYLYKERGGTFYTVEYAKKREKLIEFF